MPMTTNECATCRMTHLNCECDTFTPALPTPAHIDPHLRECPVCRMQTLNCDC